MNPLKKSRYRINLKENVYVVLFLRLAMVMLLFSVCRIAFYFFNRPFFPDTSFKDFLFLLKGGLVFDLSTVLYLNMLYILLMVIPIDLRFNNAYKSVLNYLFLVTNGIALAANVSDFIYYRFTLRRTTADVFAQFSNETNMFGLWLNFIVDYWYATVFWVLCMALLIYVSNRMRFAGPQVNDKRFYYIGGILFIPLVA